MKRALITGVTGQDGSHLSEHLLSLGYSVHGLVRRSSTFNTSRIDHLYCDPRTEGCQFFLHHGDVLDGARMRQLVEQIQPDELYHLASQSHVHVSFENPCYTIESVTAGTLNVLEAIRLSKLPVRMYQASSSEMFGNSPAPQNEETRLNPRSPYAVGKVASHHLCQLYRQAYGLFVSCGILFNHTGPRRGETFVERKITRAAGRISCGLQDKLYLGNLTARRDFGSARDYVAAMHLMLQHSQSDDFVIATGETYSIREVLDATFGDGRWVGLVEIDDRHKRPAEVHELLGDASKAASVLGWKPTMRFHAIIEEMVRHDHRLATKELIQRSVSAA